jgi:hypothetical protein
MPYIPDVNFPYKGSPPKALEAGTLGCHEALHLARTFMIIVEEHLAEHPAVRANPEWDALATTAVSALADLYHAIHKAHPAAGKPPASGAG